MDRITIFLSSVPVDEKKLATASQYQEYRAQDSEFNGLLGRILRETAMTVSSMLRPSSKESIRVVVCGVCAVRHETTSVGSLPTLIHRG